MIFLRAKFYTPSSNCTPQPLSYVFAEALLTYVIWERWIKWCSLTHTAQSSRVRHAVMMDCKKWRVRHGSGI
jgi:hypothetical protein